MAEILCQWSALPEDLPPRSAVNDYRRHWNDDRTLDRLRRALCVQCRQQAAREISPTADIQHRNGGVLLMSSPFGLFPFLPTLYADIGCQGPKFRNGL